jgi:8-oxo-dGTP diphosphatase
VREKIHVLSRGVIIDQGHILLCETLDCPKNFYFLPGGHVEYEESACEAVLREFQEEAGAVCSIKRFLGCLEHSFEHGHNSVCHNHEYNLVFELESSELRAQKEPPQLEAHIKLVWIPLVELSKIDFRPQPLKKLLPLWLSSLAPNVFSSSMVKKDKC